jgi:hypothetical protein
MVIEHILCAILCYSLYELSCVYDVSAINSKLLMMPTSLPQLLYLGLRLWHLLLWLYPQWTALSLTFPTLRMVRCSLTSY